MSADIVEISEGLSLRANRKIKKLIAVGQIEPPATSRDWDELQLRIMKHLEKTGGNNGVTTQGDRG